MEITPSTTPQSIKAAFAEDINGYCRQGDAFRHNCISILEALSLSTPEVDCVLADKGVKLLDIYDDIDKSVEAAQFYMQGAHVKASIFLRRDGTTWLEITDLTYTWEGKPFERQELRLPGTSIPVRGAEDFPRRRLKLNEHSLKVMIDLLLETKW